MTKNISLNYTEAIKAIKQAILQSRYRAAMLANREMLMLYFGVGEYISKNSREGAWGTNAIEVISTQLQKELPGLRGFSATSLKKMRTFFEAWENIIVNRPLIMVEIRQLPTDEIQTSHSQNNNSKIIIRQILSDELESDKLLYYFLSIGFTHHCEIIRRVKSHEERLFYIEQCARGFWSVEKLQYNIKSNLYAQQGSIINNFVQTISEADFRGKALRSFKDEYLLDFVGKMNFYLSALDENEKKPHENPSIGIILCKEKSNKIVEFAFRDTSKPMGVATYRTSRELPPEYKGILPDAEKLMELMGG